MRARHWAFAAERCKRTIRWLRYLSCSRSTHCAPSERVQSGRNPRAFPLAGAEDSPEVMGRVRSDVEVSAALMRREHYGPWAHGPGATTRWAQRRDRKCSPPRAEGGPTEPTGAGTVARTWTPRPISTKVHNLRILGGLEHRLPDAAARAPSGRKLRPRKHGGKRVKITNNCNQFCQNENY